jgi:hypothetical protein
MTKRNSPSTDIDAAALQRTSSSVIFDNLSRSLGSEIPRRQALKVALTSFTGAALAQLGIKSAWAAGDTCLCRGVTYDPATACCTPSGVQQKHPLTSVAACPNRVAHPGHVPVGNGCGAQGGRQFPDGFGAASFLGCCNTHDVCWGTCNNTQATCDNSFLTCLRASCDAAYPGSGLNAIKRSTCRGAANSYYAAVSSRFGTPNYEAAQAAACDCCSESTCPNSCAGSVCGSLPPCSGGADCVCFTSTEGTGACVHGSTPCSAVSRCTTTADCPAGTACLTTSCCGSFGVCGPLCNPIVPGSRAPSFANASGPTLGRA